MPISTRNCEYSDYIVGLLDVVGFSDHVTRSQQDQLLRAKIRNLLQEFNQIIEGRMRSFKAYPIRLVHFSDSIMVSCPKISEDSFRWVLWIISEFFVKSAHNGFFFRGALTIGPHWEDERTFFGPALNRASMLESSLARWPRCVIDRSALVRSDICPKGSWKKYFPYVLEGSDGLPYLDYLGYSFFMAQRIMVQLNKRSDFMDLSHICVTVLGGHQREIVQAVERVKQDPERKTTLLSKYYPLAVYHNSVIQSLTQGLPESSSLNSIEPNSEIGKMIQFFNIMGKQAGKSAKQIEDEIIQLVADLVKERIDWQQQSIDIEHIFGEAWK